MDPQAKPDTASESVDDPVIRLQDLDVVYDMSHGTSKVLNSVDLDVQRNEILGIVGESGSGKSMLAASLLDAVPKPGQTRGDVTYYPRGDRDEIKVLELEKQELKQVRWEDISMVFQGAMDSFNPTMRIRGHFLETVEAHDKDEEDCMQRARELLRDLHLPPDRVLDSYPHELSGGMQQRALIALSLVLDPEVLVMDEPTAALDLLMQRSIISMLSRLRDEYDLTILFITHDLPLVAGLTDRLSVLYAFELIEVGPTMDVLTNPAHPYTRALLGATPKITGNVDEMRPIEGTAPDPTSIPNGCSYHPRCPIAREDCSHDDPSQERVSDNHTAACFYWEDAKEEIEYTPAKGEETTGGFDL